MIKFIDLFAGIGGIRIAFENAGARCVMSSEIDKHARETYFHNFDDMPKGDISKIELAEIPDFDILTAGFPCQPFSIGGLRRGFEDTRGTLFFEILRILEGKKPKAFLLENVAGLVNHDKGQTLRVIEESLAEAGYVFRWSLMNAKDYGLPQNRNRWYCIGFRKDLGIQFAEESNVSSGEYEMHQSYIFPSPQPLEITLDDLLENGDLKDYEISEIAHYNINQYLGSFKNSDRYQKDKILLASEVRRSRCNFRNDGISPCLTAKMGTGGNNVPIVVKDFRKLTERECFRLMGFPENYEPISSSSQTYKQIGNSVVVPVVELLAKEMIRVLEQNGVD